MKITVQVPSGRAPEYLRLIADQLEEDFTSGHHDQETYWETTPDDKPVVDGVLKINGEVVPATEFAYDGCHKIYLIFTPAERQMMAGKGYGRNGDSAILPISELPDVWAATCALRFINSADLEHTYIDQCDEDSTVTFD